MQDSNDNTPARDTAPAPRTAQEGGAREGDGYDEADKFSHEGVLKWDRHVNVMPVAVALEAERPHQWWQILFCGDGYTVETEKPSKLREYRPALLRSCARRLRSGQLPDLSARRHIGGVDIYRPESWPRACALAADALERCAARVEAGDVTPLVDHHAGAAEILRNVGLYGVWVICDRVDRGRFLSLGEAADVAQAFALLNGELDADVEIWYLRMLPVLKASRRTGLPVEIV